MTTIDNANIRGAVGFLNQICIGNEHTIAGPRRSEGASQGVEQGLVRGGGALGADARLGGLLSLDVLLQSGLYGVCVDGVEGGIVDWRF